MFKNNTQGHFIINTSKKPLVLPNRVNIEYFQELPRFYWIEDLFRSNILVFINKDKPAEKKLKDYNYEKRSNLLTSKIITNINNNYLLISGVFYLSANEEDTYNYIYLTLYTINDTNWLASASIDPPIKLPKEVYFSVQYVIGIDIGGAHKKSYVHTSNELLSRELAFSSFSLKIPTKYDSLSYGNVLVKTPDLLTNYSSSNKPLSYNYHKKSSTDFKGAIIKNLIIGGFLKNDGTKLNSVSVSEIKKIYPILTYLHNKNDYTLFGDKITYPTSSTGHLKITGKYDYWIPSWYKIVIEQSGTMPSNPPKYSVQRHYTMGFSGANNKCVDVLQRPVYLASPPEGFSHIEGTHNLKNLTTNKWKYNERTLFFWDKEGVTLFNLETAKYHNIDASNYPQLLATNINMVKAYPQNSEIIVSCEDTGLWKAKVNSKQAERIHRFKSYCFDIDENGNIAYLCENGVVYNGEVIAQYVPEKNIRSHFFNLYGGSMGYLTPEDIDTVLVNSYNNTIALTLKTAGEFNRGDNSNRWNISYIIVDVNSKSYYTVPRPNSYWDVRRVVKSDNQFSYKKDIIFQCSRQSTIHYNVSTGTWISEQINLSSLDTTENGDIIGHSFFIDPTTGVKTDFSPYSLSYEKPMNYVAFSGTVGADANNYFNWYTYPFIIYLQENFGIWNYAFTNLFGLSTYNQENHPLMINLVHNGTNWGNFPTGNNDRYATTLPEILEKGLEISFEDGYYEKGEFFSFVGCEGVFIEKEIEYDLFETIYNRYNTDQPNLNLILPVLNS